MSTLVWNTSFIAGLIPVLIQSHLVYQIIAAFQAAYVGHRLLVECQEKSSWNVNCLRFHEMSSKNISWQNTTQVSRQMEDNKNILVGSLWAGLGYPPFYKCSFPRNMLWRTQSLIRYIWLPLLISNIRDEAILGAQTRLSGSMSPDLLVCKGFPNVQYALTPFNL